MEIKGNYGKCIIIDCLDKQYGLPSLKYKFDICLTDPPYGHNRHKRSDTIRNNCIVIKYNDSELIMDWFDICKEICNRILFFGGYKNIGYLLSNFPLEIGIWHNPNKQGKSKNSKTGGNKIEPFFTWNINNLSTNIIKIVPKDRAMGFYKGSNYTPKIHLTPKDSAIIEYLIIDLKPKSVIDPFLGSGTTAEVCEELGIKWLGYEIEEKYMPDIENGIKNGIKKHKERTQIKKLSDY